MKKKEKRKKKNSYIPEGDPFTNNNLPWVQNAKKPIDIDKELEELRRLEGNLQKDKE